MALTSFVGREQELAEVQALVERSRLVTLTGVGGCGKTRLTLEAAQRLAGGWPDGVRMVELAAVEDGALVPGAVATAWGLHESAGSSATQTLLTRLRDARALLVLDNCEHLLDACSTLVQTLLSTCPSLHVLCTSREPLGLGGEVLFAVPPLPVPERGDRRPRTGTRPANPDEVIAYAAVALFVERARAVRRDFQLTPENAAAVVETCRRLDGLPLAIELAAARVSVLAPRQIAERLDDAFALLTNRDRTVLPRQQTLRAVIDWSHDLLPEPERMLLRRLAVFSGGFTLEAVEAIGSPESADQDSTLDAGLPTLDSLVQLVERSLVVVEPGSEWVRYHLLETVRQYAAEKLAAAGEVESLRNRHRDWYLQLAEEAETRLIGPDQSLWYRRLEAERDNLRAALRWCLERGQDETGMRVAAALERFWTTCGYFSEGYVWLETFLTRTEAAGDRSNLRFRAIFGASMLVERMGDSARAEALLDEALELARSLEDQYSIGRALIGLGMVRRDRGDAAGAFVAYEEALGIWREMGHQRGISVALAHLGSLARNAGEYARATAYWEEALELGRRGGDTLNIAEALRLLGLVAADQSDYRRALPLHEESLAIRRQMGDRHGMPGTLATMGMMAEVQGDYASAVAIFEEGLTLARETGHRLGEAQTLRMWGDAALRYEDPRASALLQESLVIYRDLSEPAGVAETLVSQVLLALGGADLERAAMLLAEALELCDEATPRRITLGARLAQGALAATRGDLPAAEAACAEALAGYREMGSPLGQARSLEALAALAVSGRRPERAARLLGSAAAVRERIGAPPAPTERAMVEAVEHAARAMLGEDAFAAAERAGHDAPPETALAEAMPG